nr:MAG TPA: hypothetical protein [Caudoviricetes sp.]
MNMLLIILRVYATYPSPPLLEGILNNPVDCFVAIKSKQFYC